MKPGQRLTCTGYAKALRVIVNGGATWRTVASELDAGRITAHALMRGFHAMGLMHIADWKSDGDARSRSAVYVFGPGIDVTNPSGRKAAKRKAPGIELLTFCHAIKALQTENHHGLSLAEETGYNPRTARKALRVLHSARLIFIAEFQDRRYGAGYPMYAWGPGERDVKKPAPRSKKELWTRHNQERQSRELQARQMQAVVLGKAMDKRTVSAREAVSA